MGIFDKIRRSRHTLPVAVFLAMAAVLAALSASYAGGRSDFSAYTAIATEDAEYRPDTGELAFTYGGRQIVYSCDEHRRLEMEDMSRDREIIGVALTTQVPRSVLRQLDLDPDAVDAFILMTYPELDAYFTVTELFWSSEEQIGASDKS